MNCYLYHNGLRMKDGFEGDPPPGVTSRLCHSGD
jgi:hypothetical protein